jgi:hypothetical protein
LKERLQKLPEHEKLESILPSECAAYEEAAKGIQEWYEKFGNFFVINGQEKEKVAIREEIRTVVRQAGKKEKKQEEKVMEQAKNQSEQSKEAAAPPTVTVPLVDSSDLSSPPVVLIDSSSPDFHPPSIEQLTEFLGFYDSDLATHFTQAWSSFESQYTQTVKSALRCLRQQRWAILEYFSVVRSNFLRFLNRTDYSSKQSLLDQFQSAFNSIPYDWRADPATKEELLFRVDELCDKLFSIAQQRRSDALNEFSCIVNHFQQFFVDCHSAIYSHYYLTLLQAEIDRYMQTIKITRDYFSVLKGGALVEENIPKIIQLPFPGVNFSAIGQASAGSGLASPAGKKEKSSINVQTISLGSLNLNGGVKDSKKDAKKSTGKSGTSAAPAPANDQIEFSNPFTEIIELLPTILSQPEEILDQIQAAIASQQALFTTSLQGGASSDASKRKDSASGPTASPGLKYRIHIEKRQRPQLEFLFDSQLSYCIQVENKLLLNRAKKILSHAIARVYNMKLSFYQHLVPRADQWIQLKLKGETMAIEQLGEWIKVNCVEKGRPIEEMLRIEGESLFIEKDCLLQLVPGNAKRSDFTDALNNTDENDYRRWFTIPQLRSLMNSLLPQSASSAAHLLSAERLFSSLTQLRDLQFSHSIPLERYCLPHAWTQNPNVNLIRDFVLNFQAPQEEFQSNQIKGEVDLKHLLTVLAICSFAAGKGNEGQITPNLDSLRALMSHCIQADSSMSGSISWSAFQSAPLPFFTANGPNSLYWSSSASDFDSAQTQVREFFFDLFGQPIGRDRNSWTLPYATLVFYLAFSDQEFNGSEKVRILLNEFNPTLTASAQLFLERTKPGAAHTARYRLPDLSHFVS